jgi:hypothetical protein
MASQLGQGLVLPSTFQDYSRSIERFYKWINRKYSKSVKGSHAMDIALTKLSSLSWVNFFCELFLWYLLFELFTCI